MSIGHLVNTFKLKIEQIKIDKDTNISHGG
jgi:hypothetical protein